MSRIRIISQLNHMQRMYENRMFTVWAQHCLYHVISGTVDLARSCCQSDRKWSTTAKHVFINYVQRWILCAMCLSARWVNKCLEAAEWRRTMMTCESMMKLSFHVLAICIMHRWRWTWFTAHTTFLFSLLPFQYYYFIFHSIWWFLFFFSIHQHRITITELCLFILSKSV